MLRAALKSIPSLPTPLPPSTAPSSSWVGGCGHGASFLTFLQELKGENLSSKQTQRSGNKSVDGPKVKRKGNRKPKRKKNDPRPEVQEGAEAQNSSEGSGTPGSSSLLTKTAASALCLHPGDSARCQTTALLMEMWRNSFTAVPKGLGAQQEPGRAGEGSSSSPGAQVQEGRGKAEKGQDTFSCSSFLPSPFPLAMPVLTFVPPSPLCFL